jgi:hypothetical protein
MQFNPMIFVLIPALVTVIYGSSSGFEACALPPDPNFGQSPEECLWFDKNDGTGDISVTCCWEESRGPNQPPVTVCQACTANGDGVIQDCGTVDPLFERPGVPSDFPSAPLEDLLKDSKVPREGLMDQLEDLLKDSKVPQKDVKDQLEEGMTNTTKNNSSGTNVPEDGDVTKKR